MKTDSLTAFKTSLSAENPPENLSVYGKALWYAGKGNWQQSHNLVQDMEDKPAARIHAFLHRQEGDISNARYWYARAGATIPTGTVDEEWNDLVSKFID